MTGSAALRDLPRVELHCHLDGCVRITTIERLAQRRGLAFERPVADLAVAAPRPTTLVDYLRAIDVALAVMQSAAELERIAAELVEDWIADGVVHGEVRFAPQLHTRQGLTMVDAVDAVATGLARGRRGSTMTTALILCCLRDQSPDVSLAVAELAVRRRDAVDGIDLAGPEAGNPAALHRRAFDVARAAGLPVTAHAGEAAGPDSVREAIDLLGAERVGHGVRSVGDPALVDELARRGITLECCPTSNVQTGAVTDIESHPIDHLQRAGVAVTVSTDGRTTSATTITHELELVTATFGWGATEHTRAQRAAATAAFTSPARRQELLDQISQRVNG